MIVRCITLAIAALVLCSTGAEARRHKHHRHHRHHHNVAVPPAQQEFCGFFQPCPVPNSPPARRTHERVALGREGYVVEHPSGCPRRAFCGCGAAVRIFGQPVRSLWLAVEWLRRFPRAAPAPGMVAARRHHVFVLERHVAGNIWLVYDANSGGHRTRIHHRSIAGYSIVNPRT